MPLPMRSKREPSHIITGVHNANYIAWLWEVEGIDLGPEDSPEGHEKGLDCYAVGQWPVLYGDWSKKNGQYTPKRGCRFAAIFNPETNTVQVVKSIFAQYAAISAALATQAKGISILWEPIGPIASLQNTWTTNG